MGVLESFCNLRDGNHCLEGADGMHTLKNDLLKETNGFFLKSSLERKKKRNETTKNCSSYLEGKVKRFLQNAEEMIKEMNIIVKLINLESKEQTMKPRVSYISEDKASTSAIEVILKDIKKTLPNE